MQITDIKTVKDNIFIRPDDAHKGTLGSLLCICGSYGMAGAAMMAGKSALRCGVGLLKLAIVKSIYPICATNILESVFLPLEEKNGKISKSNIPFLLEQCNNSSAVLIGCGLAVCEDTKEVVFSIIENCEKPLIIDADALNCISENIEILKKAKSKIIITPHPAEMGRLINLSAKEVNLNREKIAVDFSKEYNLVTVLKGANTVIANEKGDYYINPTGNSGMATGGSGDVLAGIISSMVAQGGDTFGCAVSGVYIHGLAGDITAKKLGKISMLPTDVIENISNAYNIILQDNIVI